MSAASKERTEADAASELVARIGAGEADAEAELVARYSRVVVFFLRRQTGDPALADDLHQETFRIVLLRLRESGLAQPEKLAQFLRRTARNLVIDHFRKIGRRRTDSEEEAIARTADAAPGALHQVLGREQAGLVRRLIGELKSARDRQLLFRYYVAEEDKVRLCDHLGLSSRHFDRVLFRARQRLKELLEGFEKQQRLAPSGMRTRSAGMRYERAS